MTAAPVSNRERLPLIDVLRGFALLGILIANFGSGPGNLMPRLDQALETSHDILIWNSFYPLYAFLFGLGFAAMLQRGEARGALVLHRYLRRLLVLLLIGAAHKVLIWDGDILIEYAILGFWLIPLSRLSARPLAAIIVLLAVFYLMWPRIEPPRPGQPGSAVPSVAAQLAQGVRDEATTAARGELLAAETRGAVWRLEVQSRWRDFAAEVRHTFTFPRILGDDILIYFLVGLYAGKKRWLERVAERHRSFVVALLAGIAGGGLSYWQRATNQELFRELYLLVYYWGEIGVTIAWVALIALLFTAAGRSQRVLQLLAPAGRMGLTNYLLQSVVMTALFFDYGLDLPDLGTTVRFGVHLAFFFLIQVPMSHWWLARFQFGPVEWLWRSLTYGVRQPMRLATRVP